MIRKKKEFSILKWVIFPLNSITLAAIVAFFNLSIFGYRDGLPYSIIVCLIGLFSIVINRYTESSNRTLARAAFIFEITLTVALIINACYSVSVQRRMSVARMAESSQAETIDKISKLRGSRTQREALQKVDKPVAAQTIFGDVEAALFWIMCGELALYGLASFSLFAIAKLMDDDEDPKTPADVEGEFPRALDIEKRQPAKRQNFTTQTTQKDIAKTHESSNFNQEGMERLKDVLRDISFRLPGYSFKSHVKNDALWIRLMRARHGTQETVSSAKAKLSLLDDAVKMDREAFRKRLEIFLSENGFGI